MVDLDSYSDETIAKAFWLQEKIRRDGIEGIGFMSRGARAWIDDGPDTVADVISRQLRGL